MHWEEVTAGVDNPARQWVTAEYSALAPLGEDMTLILPVHFQRESRRSLGVISGPHLMNCLSQPSAWIVGAPGSTWQQPCCANSVWPAGVSQQGGLPGNYCPHTGRPAGGQPTPRQQAQPGMCRGSCELLPCSAAGMQSGGGGSCSFHTSLRERRGLLRNRVLLQLCVTPSTHTNYESKTHDVQKSWV